MDHWLKKFINKPILDFPDKNFVYWNIKIGLGWLTVHMLDRDAGVTDLHVAGGQQPLHHPRLCVHHVAKLDLFLAKLFLE